MAGFSPFEPSNDGESRKFQIAHRVQYLVAHELVLVALEGRVHQRVTVDHKGVSEIGTPAEARSAKLLGLLEEPEGAGGRDLAAEGLAVKDTGELPAAR